jgi:hypothetical protein
MGLERFLIFGSVWYGRVSSSPSVTGNAFIANVVTAYQLFGMEPGEHGTIWFTYPSPDRLYTFLFGCLKLFTFIHRLRTTHSNHSDFHMSF